MKTLAVLTWAGLLFASGMRSAEQPVKVTDEPHHRTVLENAQLRVIDVRIPAGGVTKYHVHSLPSVIVYLTKSTNRSQTWGETTASPRTTTPGDSRYANYDEKPLTHQVTNPGPAEFRVLDIELLQRAGATPAMALALPSIKLQWEQPLVRSYSVSLAPGAQLDVPGANGHLAIGIAGTTEASAGGSRRELQNGDYAYHAPKTSFQLRNIGTEKAELVLLELK